MSTLLEQASLIMIPSGYKEDVVYSVIPENGNGDLSFTRASNGTRVNSAGLVEVVPWNLQTYSQDFSNAVWSIINGTATHSQTDPNGGTSATKIVFSSVGTLETTLTDLSTTDAYTLSIYVRSESGSVNFQIGNLSGGAFVTHTATTTWQRFEVSQTPTGATRYPAYVKSTGATTLYVAFAQLNIGSTANPYFPTTDRLNVPRLTYQNGGGGCPSLLLEKQSTNLALYSEQFDNAGWVNQDINVSANASISPDGTTNADKLIPNTSNTDHAIYQSSATSVVRTFSVYAKANGYNYIFVGSNNSAATDGVFFDLTNGTISQNTSTLTPSIESVGNGWYRCIVSQASWPSANALVCVSQNGTSFYFAGNGTDGISVWGAQLEASSYPTSYIPTTSSSATRVADLAVKSSISSLFGASATSLFMDFEITQVSSVQRFTVTGYNGSYLFSLCQFDDINNYPRIVFEGGVDTTLGTALSIGRHKIAVSFATNDLRAYIDGTLVLTDTSCTYNQYDRIAVNGAAWSGNANNDNSFKLNQYAQFPNVLTNAELASLTTI